MRCLVLATFMAAGLGLAACSDESGARSIPGEAVGVARMSQTCDREFAECITLAYNSPFGQELCVNYYGDIIYGPSCGRIRSTRWGWSLGPIKGYGRYRHRPDEKIQASFSPNPGDPTTLTISEKERTRSSHGAIAYSVGFRASLGDWGTQGSRIGIIIK